MRLIIAAAFICCTLVCYAQSPTKLSADQQKRVDELFDLALAAHDQRNYAKEAEYYELLLAINPNHESAWNNYGRTQIRLGKYKEAIHSLNRQLEINPLDHLAYRNLAKAYIGLGEFENVISACRAQLKTYPQDDFCNEQTGHFLRVLGRFKEAIPVLEMAAKITPSEPMVFLDLAECYLKTGERDKAPPLLKHAVEIAPVPAVWSWVAVLLAENHLDLEQAKSYAESASTILGNFLRNAPPAKLTEDGPKISEELIESWEALAVVCLDRNELQPAEEYATASWRQGMSSAGTKLLLEIYAKQRDNSRTAEFAAEYLAFESWPSARAGLVRWTGSESKAAEAIAAAQTKIGLRRTYRLTSGPTLDRTAYVALVLRPDGTIESDNFAQGDRDLWASTKEAVGSLKLWQTFPVRLANRLVRKARVECNSSVSRCDLVLDIDDSPDRAISQAERAMLPAK